MITLDKGGGGLGSGEKSSEGMDVVASQLQDQVSRTRRCQRKRERQKRLQAGSYPAQTRGADVTPNPTQESGTCVPGTIQPQPLQAPAARVEPSMEDYNKACQALKKDFMDLLQSLERGSTGGPLPRRGKAGVRSMLLNFQREFGNAETNRRVEAILGKMR